jgi:hypothetical protein
MILGSISILDPLNYIGTDKWATIDEQLHEHTPELGDLLVPLVQAKTPELTGALASDMTYDAYTNPESPGTGDEDLVYVYASGAQQIAAWDRIYVQYQEGGALGMPTYTNAPHEMFAITAETDGLAVTVDWATTYIEYANLLCLSGAGIPY